MPRDPRPYLTFPIGYTIHPRVDMLSDRAFRAFHEMNDYCRINKTDGRIARALARKRWPVKVLAELVTGDGDRPLLMDEGDTYFLRSYAEHQWTNDDAEALRLKRVEAGRAGGKAKARNASKGLANGLASASPKGWQNVAESRVKARQTDDGDSRPQLTEVDAGEGDETEFFAEAARTVGIKNLRRVRDALVRVVGPMQSDGYVIDLARAVILLANEPVRSVEAYIEKACANSPDEVRARWAAIGGGV